MAVAVSDVRFQIADMPRLFPANSEAPDTIGVGDGVNTIFFLRYPNLIASSLVMYLGTLPAGPGPGSTAYVAQAGAAYAVSNSNQITFVTAPASGVIVGSRYQATAFADTDLQNYLTRAKALQSDDRLVLKQTQFDLIDAILADVEKLTLLREADYSRDPNVWQAGYLKLKGELRKDLTGDPRPGANVPAFGVVTQSLNRYEVPR